MTFNANLVVSIKSKNKILKENHNQQSPTVYIPFQSEYSLYFKNLNSKRAVVKVSIDGEDVLNGNKLVIDSNSTYDLERFIKDLNEGNKFKFIQKTQQISNYRGDRIDDGIIRIEYQFEKPYNIPELPIWQKSLDNKFTSDELNNVYCSNLSSVNCSTLSTLSTPLRSFNEDGITTKGSVSNQQFTTISVGELEPKVFVITIMLKGEDPNLNQPITQPIYSKMKSKCNVCGTTFRGFPQFCSKCGSAINAEI